MRLEDEHAVGCDGPPGQCDMTRPASSRADVKTVELQSPKSQIFFGPLPSLLFNPGLPLRPRSWLDRAVGFRTEGHAPK